MAAFRGWTPVIALQIEYSLLERTVEGELIPMALELGLGVTPWGPLRGGALSGKYTRDNAATLKADRGERVTAFLNEKSYMLIDELARIARELGTQPAAVALAWVQGRPGVASTIIGARRMEQLNQNLAALDVVLTPEHAASLDRLTEPSLDFPAGFVKTALMFSQGGTTVNGHRSVPWPMAPKSDAERH
jgi:aryl-alcohol dehydrogenase-like predicted oxidoreductase